MLLRRNLTAALILGVCACAPRRTVVPPPMAPLSIDARILRDDAGGIQSKEERVIRDSTEWRDIWGRATSRQSRPAALPQVDFRNNMVVLVATGAMTVADEIHIDSVASRTERTDAGRTQEVVWVYYSVVRDCPASTREAFPMEIVRVRRSTATVRFNQKTERGPNCRV